MTHILAMPDRINLWKHNPTTGYWELCRACLVEDSAQWLAIFQKDEPYTWFRLSLRRPRACGNRKAVTL